MVEFEANHNDDTKDVMHIIKRK